MSKITAAEFILEVYGEDKQLDGTLLGRFMNCMNINPSQETLKKMGMTEKVGKSDQYVYFKLLARQIVMQYLNSFLHN